MLSPTIPTAHGNGSNAPYDHQGPRTRNLQEWTERQMDRTHSTTPGQSQGRTGMGMHSKAYGNGQERGHEIDDQRGARECTLASARRMGMHRISSTDLGAGSRAHTTTLKEQCIRPRAPKRTRRHTWRTRMHPIEPQNGLNLKPTMTWNGISMALRNKTPMKPMADGIRFIHERLGSLGPFRYARRVHSGVPWFRMPPGWSSCSIGYRLV